MANRLCPVCSCPGKLLPDSSKDALVEYFRCDPCGQVWTHKKFDPYSRPVRVTDLPESRLTNRRNATRPS